MKKQERMKWLLKLQELQRKHCDKIHFDISTQCETSLDNSKLDNEFGLNYINVNINIFRDINIINHRNFSFSFNTNNTDKDIERTYQELTSYIELLYKEYYNDSPTGV